MKPTATTVISRVAHCCPRQFRSLGRHPVPIMAIDRRTRIPNTASDIAICVNAKFSPKPASPIKTLMTDRNTEFEFFIGEPFSESDNVRVIRAAKPVCRRTMERGKVLNPEYSIFRDQPIAGASPLRINRLLPRLWCELLFDPDISLNAVNGRRMLK